MKLPLRGWRFRLQVIGAAVVCALALLFAFPSLFGREDVARWPDWLPKSQLDLAIEFAGGTSLLLEPDMDQVRLGVTRDARNTMRTALRESRIRYENLRADATSISLAVPDGDQRPSALGIVNRVASQWKLDPSGPPVFGPAELSDDGRISVRVLDSALPELRRLAIAFHLDRLSRLLKCLGYERFSVEGEGDRIRVILRSPPPTTTRGTHCQHI